MGCEAEGVVHLDGKVDGIVRLAEAQAEGEQHGVGSQARAEEELLVVAVFHAQTQPCTLLALAFNDGEQLRQRTVLGLHVQTVRSDSVPGTAAAAEGKDGVAAHGGLQQGCRRHPLLGGVVAVRGAEVQVAGSHAHLQPFGGAQGIAGLHLLLVVVEVAVVLIVGHHSPSLRRGPDKAQAFVGHAGHEEALPVVEAHEALAEVIDNGTTHSAVACAMGGGELCLGDDAARQGDE